MSSFSPQPLRLGQLLVEARVITDDVLEEALALATRERQRLGEALVAMGAATVEDVLKAVAAQQALPYLSAEELPSTPPVLKELSPRYLRQAVACPIAVEGTTVTVATADPTDPLLLDELQQTLPLAIRLCVAPGARHPGGHRARLRRQHRAPEDRGGHGHGRRSPRPTPRTTSITCATWPSRRRWCAWSIS